MSELKPWQKPPLDKWAICGMNHYHINGEKFLFVSMVKNGLCITEEGKDDKYLWNRLWQKATNSADMNKAIEQAKKENNQWMPIESAPKGGGAEMTTDPNWVDPPKILLLFENGEVSVGCWEWYYAEGGRGYIDGIAWIESTSGEVLSQYYDAPTHWMPLPSPPDRAIKAVGGDE